MKKTTINFSKENNGLIPTIVQDNKTNAVLMLGFMNKQAFQKTKKTGFVNFWSRSRKKLWLKGEESGNMFKVKKLFLDCDNDTILIIVELIGDSACHTKNYSCFFREIKIGGKK